MQEYIEANDLYVSLVQAFRQRVISKTASQNVDFQHVWLRSPESKAIIKEYRQEIRRLPLHQRLLLARRLAQSEISLGINFANAVLELSTKELGPADFAYLDEHLNLFEEAILSIP